MFLVLAKVKVKGLDNLVVHVTPFEFEVADFTMYNVMNETAVLQVEMYFTAKI